MKIYIRKKDDHKWHWVFECPEYPEGDKIEKIYRKPSDEELCTVCKRIEAEGRQKGETKEIINDENLH
jgi:hypothetical protein